MKHSAGAFAFVVAGLLSLINHSRAANIAEVDIRPLHATIYGYGEAMVGFDATANVSLPNSGVASEVRLRLPHDLAFLQSSVIVTASGNCLITQHSDHDDHSYRDVPDRDALEKESLGVSDELARLAREAEAETTRYNIRQRLWKEMLDTAQSMKAGALKNPDGNNSMALLNRSLSMQQEAMETQAREDSSRYENQTARKAQEAALRSQLSDLARRKQPIAERHRFIKATVACFGAEDGSATAVSTQLSVSLHTPARWVPEYLLHVDSIRGSARATFLAKIEQESGIPWTNVTVELSTSKEKENANDAGLAALPPLTLESSKQREAMRQQDKDRIEAMKATLNARKAELERAKERAKDFRALLAIQRQIREVEEEHENIADAIRSEAAEEARLRREGRERRQKPLPRKKHTQQRARVFDEGMNLAEVGDEEEELRSTFTTASVLSASATYDTVTLESTSTRIPLATMKEEGSGGEGRQAKAPKTKDIQSSSGESTLGGVEAFVLHGLQSVPAHFAGQPAPRLAVGGVDLDCAIGRHAVPESSHRVHLTANLSNNKNSDGGGIALLAGEATLILDGRHAGTIPLPSMVSGGGAVAVPLGKDQRMHVSRRIIERSGEKQSSFMSQTKRQQKRTVALSAVNRRSSAVNIVLEDRVPVCADKEVVIDVSLPPAGGNVHSVHRNHETGIVLFNVTVPGATNVAPGSTTVQFGSSKQTLRRGGVLDYPPPCAPLTGYSRSLSASVVGV